MIKDNTLIELKKKVDQNYSNQKVRKVLITIQEIVFHCVYNLYIKLNKFWWRTNTIFFSQN